MLFEVFVSNKPDFGLIYPVKAAGRFIPKELNEDSNQTNASLIVSCTKLMVRFGWVWVRNWNLSINSSYVHKYPRETASHQNDFVQKTFGKFGSVLVLNIMLVQVQNRVVGLEPDLHHQRFCCQSSSLSFGGRGLGGLPLCDWFRSASFSRRFRFLLVTQNFSKSDISPGS